MSHVSAIFNFEFSTLITCPFQMLHFDSNPISIGHLVAEIWAFFEVLKTMKNIRICHFFKPVTQNQYSWHPSHSPWSCHICASLWACVLCLTKVRQPFAYRLRRNVIRELIKTENDSFGCTMVLFSTLKFVYFSRYSFIRWHVLMCRPWKCFQTLYLPTLPWGCKNWGIFSTPWTRCGELTKEWPAAGWAGGGGVRGGHVVVEIWSP